MRVGNQVMIGRESGGVVTIFVAALLALTPCVASGHDPGLSSSIVELGREAATARITLSAHDLAGLVRFDENGDELLDIEEVARAEQELRKLATSALDLRFGESRLAPARVELVAVDAGAEIVMRVEFALPVRDPLPSRGSVSIRTPLLEHMPHGHRQFVRLIDRDGAVLSTQLLRRHDVLLFCPPDSGS